MPRLDLSKFTISQLNKMQSDADLELRRRDSVSNAEKEIRAILNKYNITIDDINFAALRSSVKSSRKRKAVAKRKTKGAGVKDNRATVAAKYLSLDGNVSWSGRGRAPKWVVSQCESEGISVDAFKKDKRFLIT